MRLRRIGTPHHPSTQLATPGGWIEVVTVLDASPDLTSDIPSTDLLTVLSVSQSIRDRLQAAADLLTPSELTGPLLLPFQPASYRDFMLYETHVVNASRGFVRRFLPRLYRFTSLYERFTFTTFPAFKPRPLWFKEPIYYMGNHLAFVGDGATLPWPPYCTMLDYELELGFVLTRPLFNATPQEAEAAIGGFVIFNDVSARNVQRAEMTSDFGPQKAKHFCNVLGAEVVSADELLPHWQNLTGTVSINGRVVATVNSSGPRYTLGEVLAHASHSEPLQPGEFFGTGTLPGGSGLENGQVLQHGDLLRLQLDRVGAVTNTVTR